MATNDAKVYSGLYYSSTADVTILNGGFVDFLEP